jgi:hypothetical protein
MPIDLLASNFHRICLNLEIRVTLHVYVELSRLGRRKGEDAPPAGSPFLLLPLTHLLGWGGGREENTRRSRELLPEIRGPI